ncbi:transposase [Microcoleus sp. CAWBG58]|uniref:RNA-guided endonuclease InsQ/TnpB family protein n=1 Tax=Microcoleus sp. CAWBG58 TaxID=2841651 RepID=UPI0025F0FEA4|nr:transposase [Microcoleus sp. CAWBG58]
MQLVEKHVIKPSYRFYREADRLSWLYKNLYNCANYIYCQNFFANEQTNHWAADRAFKTTSDYKALPAKVAKSTLGLLLKAWTRYHVAVRNYREDPTKFKAAPKIPDYQDSKERKRAGWRYVVVLDSQAACKKVLKKVYAHPSGTNIWLASKVTWILEIRIVLKVGCYIVEVVHKKLEQPLQVNQRVAAIDLELNNLATLIYNIAGLVPKIYDGRALKSTNQYCNRVSSTLKSLLPATQKNSKKVANLWHKRNCKVDYYLHITSSAIIKELVNHQIGLLVVGGNQDLKDGINPGKVNPQKFACIPHRRLVQMLQYKGQIAEIQVLLVGESYTSKCSALDLEPIQQKSEYIGCRVKRGLFRTQSGQLINAAVSGSLNEDWPKSSRRWIDPKFDRGFCS